MMDQQQLTFDDIYRMKYKLICQYIEQNIRYDADSAEDIASEVFLLLYKKWDTIIHKTEVSLTAWLYHTAEFYMLSHRKKVLRHSKVVVWEDIEELHIKDDVDFIDAMQRDEEYRDLLHQIRMELSEQEWELFEAIYMKKENSDNITQRTGMTCTKLYALRRRMRNKVKKVLKNKKI